MLSFFNYQMMSPPPPTLHHVALFSSLTIIECKKKSSAHDAAPSQSYHRPAVDFMTYLFVSWPWVILSCHLASVSAYVRLGQRFAGDSKCGLNKPDIAHIMWEMMWQPADKCCHVSMQHFLAPKISQFPKYENRNWWAALVWFVNSSHFSACAFPLVVQRWPPSRKLLWPPRHCLGCW